MLDSCRYAVVFLLAPAAPTNYENKYFLCIAQISIGIRLLFVISHIRPNIYAVQNR